MSFEQDPYDREDEEIRQAFAAKDAEISGLKDELAIAAGKTDVQAYDRMLQELAEKDFEIARLRAIIASKDEYIQDKKEENERLKADLAYLIKEIQAVLKIHSSVSEFLQRAWEASGDE